MTLTEAIEEVRKIHFRTQSDTGAHPNAMIILNTFNRLAGLPRIKHSELDDYCLECKKYHQQPMCNVESTKESKCNQTQNN